MKKKIIAIIFILSITVLSAADKTNLPKGKVPAEKPVLTATFCYEDGVVKYVGEVANGKENGKGISYDMYGKKIFEGQFKNGSPNGLGKLYDENGNLNYEGEVVNGVPTENGTWFITNVSDLNVNTFAEIDR